MKNHRDLIDAEYSLNSDGGDFQTRDGKPFSIAVAAGEKKETILQLETHNRGGHGSVPPEDNAIYQLAAALDRIEKLRFPVRLNDVTRAQFAALSALESGQVAADMKAASRDPADPAAIERLSEDPYYNALLRTTCVATMLDAGPRPQRAPAARQGGDQLPDRARAYLRRHAAEPSPGHLRRGSGDHVAVQ